MKIDLSRFYFLNNVFIIYILILLASRFELFEKTAFFTSYTPDYISYNWMGDFKYSFLIVPTIIYMTIIFIKNQKKIFSASLFKFFVILCFINFCGLALNDFIIKYNSYEMFYAVLFAISILTIIEYKLITLSNYERFFEIFIYLHALGILFILITSAQTGRLNAQNLDFGSSAVLFSYYAIYLWLIKCRINVFTLLVPIILIFLTGGRTPFIVLAIVSCIKLLSRLNIKQLKIFFLMLSFIVATLLVAPYIISKLNIDIDRYTNLLSLNNIQNDDSFIGRIVSANAGIDILKDNPLGLSFSFLQLQTETNIRNYPTFPHSMFICLYLELGLLGIPFLYYLIKLFRKIRVTPYRYFLYYFLIYGTIAGGPIINLKIYFLYFLIFMMMTYSIQKNKYLNPYEKYKNKYYYSKL